MGLGGLLLGLVFSCNAKVEAHPPSVTIESASVCNSKPKGLKDSQKSSVVISFLDASGEEVGKASGNYFKYRRNTFILTAAHVADVPGEVELVVKERWGTGKSKVRAVYVDSDNDIGILVLENKLETVKPLKWKSKNIWDVEVGDELYYTGNPMDMERISLRGFVSKVYADEIIMQSFAYMGASGSAVFDKRGKVIGVISAIKFDVPGGMFPQLLPTVVLVGPLGALSNNELHDLLEKSSE